MSTIYLHATFHSKLKQFLQFFQIGFFLTTTFWSTVNTYVENTLSTKAKILFAFFIRHTQNEPQWTVFVFSIFINILCIAPDSIIS